MTAANDNHRKILKIAVTIATLDRPRQLAQLFHALQPMVIQGAYSLQPGFIVVGNGVNADAQKVCQQASCWFPYPIQYTEEPKVGLSFARNKTVEMALQTDASLIAWIDDDNIPDPDWLLQIVERQRTTNADMVLGYSHTLKMDGTKGAKLKLAGTANLLMTRGWLQAHAPDGKLFSERFNFIGSEDRDIITQAQKLGAKVVLATSSVVGCSYNAQRSTMRGMYRKGLKSGYGEMLVAIRHGDKKKLFALCALVVKKIAQLALYASVLSPCLLWQSVRAKNSYRLGRAWGVLYALSGGSDLYYYGNKHDLP